MDQVSWKQTLRQKFRCRKYIGILITIAVEESGVRRAVISRGEVNLWGKAVLPQLSAGVTGSSDLGGPFWVVSNCDRGLGPCTCASTCHWMSKAAVTGHNTGRGSSRWWRVVSREPSSESFQGSRFSATGRISASVMEVASGQHKTVPSTSA